MSQLDVPAIGRRIGAYRRRNHWSAQHLADNTDGAVSRATIANIEAGRRTSIGLEQFLAISLALRVPPVALLLDLDRPLDTSGINFPGSAPAPLEPGAPTIAVARWINAEIDGATTEGARHVTDVLALVASYLRVADSSEAAAAGMRRSGASSSPLSDYAAQQENLRRHLTAIGVHLPVSDV